MAYRSDLDALEARYRALHAEVVERTRERDEVAEMVAEAHERHDRAFNELARRQRQRSEQRIAVTVIATATLVVAGIVGAGLARPGHRHHQEAVLDTFIGFADEMCACRDKACAEAVQDQITKWATEMSQSKDSDAPDPSLMTRFSEQTTRYSDCMTKLYMP